MGSSTFIGGSHLTFRKCPLRKGRKLPKYKIINHTFDQEIGIIHWRGGWYQYVSQMDPKIDVSISCHIEITKFMRKLMKEFRAKKKKVKG